MSNRINLFGAILVIYTSLVSAENLRNNQSKRTDSTVMKCTPLKKTNGKGTIMKNFVNSSDGVSIHYTISGSGDLALVFVHGWLGNGNWWNSQEEYFQKEHTIVKIDLAGHGKSGKNRIDWSGKLYADDINAVLNQIDVKKIILIGHSMAGAFVLKASLNSPNVQAVILVDTFKDLDQVITIEQAENMMFANYRKDFKNAIENILPRYLFCESTPLPIRKQLQEEFLKNEPIFAIKVLEPLYKMDLREIAKSITVPVRSINSSFTPTNSEINKKYFKDYNFVSIDNTGHYPMLEKPAEFNKLLLQVLKSLNL